MNGACRITCDEGSLSYIKPLKTLVVAENKVNYLKFCFIIKQKKITAFKEINIFYGDTSRY